MVKIKNTPTRQKAFLDCYFEFVRLFHELDKLGISVLDMMNYFKNIGEDKVIFEQRLFFDKKKRKLIFQSNFPENWEYFFNMVRKENRIPVLNPSEIDAEYLAQYSENNSSFDKENEAEE